MSDDNGASAAAPTVAPAAAPATDNNNREPFVILQSDVEDVPAFLERVGLPADTVHYTAAEYEARFVNTVLQDMPDFLLKECSTLATREARENCAPGTHVVPDAPTDLPAPTFASTQFETLGQGRRPYEREETEAVRVLQRVQGSFYDECRAHEDLRTWERYQKCKEARSREYFEEKYTWLKGRTGPPPGELMEYERQGLVNDGLAHIKSLLERPIFCDSDVIGKLDGWVGARIVELAEKDDNYATLVKFLQHINTIPRAAELRSGRPHMHGFNVGWQIAEYLAHRCTPARGNWDWDDKEKKTAWSCDWHLCRFGRQCARRWQDPFDGAIPVTLYDTISCPARGDSMGKPLYTRVDSDGVKWTVVPDGWYESEGRNV